ncbi:hypothetical protein OMP44_23490 [Pseudomonas sp. CBMAI 2609]|uniref:Methyltransferase domain-containing protein n=1 Tax=Pseudomonas flavocrustae TaxID=2991719 RepID=A0ABT6IQD8_9PSED|nr:O-methyltransferase [Pseudomonas sp. CBMAI 2609]MDH4765860.1 hypothetical protein [Pseudomonas sp. CBMAI 2609]
MSSSFRKIDYSLRPAKYAERKMLVDVLRRLTPFQAVEDYCYIGFGSVWFSDFILFHRMLGINKMISIEQAETARARFEENRPFNINIEFGNSSTVLPSLDWSERVIVWLDYDDPLEPEMLQDVRSIANRARSGSVLAVSLQCVKAPSYVDYERDMDEGKMTAIERFRQTFGRERVPDDARDDDLTGWPYGTLSRKMLINEIELALAERNLSSNTNLKFKAICEIEYRDDARMCTLVGAFVEDDENERLEACAFQRLDFMPANQRPIRIEMPKLTIRELRKIEQQLPKPAERELELGSIPASDAEKFSRMYRYLPNFAVMEI